MPRPARPSQAGHVKPAFYESQKKSSVDRIQIPYVRSFDFFRRIQQQQQYSTLQSAAAALCCSVRIQQVVLPTIVPADLVGTGHRDLRVLTLCRDLPLLFFSFSFSIPFTLFALLFIFAS